MALIKQVTRFNPTTNGQLHVGHIYMALLNEGEAHSTGGKFILRFEDNQPEWVWRSTEKQIEEYIEGMIEDFNWLGIKVDEYQFHTMTEKKVQETIEYLNHGKLIAEHRFMFDTEPEIYGANDVHYPYAPHLTAEKVINDFLSGVNLIIRGEDLISEFSLYAYFCDIWGIPRPRHVYMPRMHMDDGSELQAEISKTSGNYKIANYRKQGYSPDYIHDKLRDACLIDPQGEWALRNVKWRPSWNG